VEIIPRKDVIKFNSVIEDWKPNVSYPLGAIVKYRTNTRYSSSNTSNLSYAKRVCGYFNLNAISKIGGSSSDP